VLVEPSREEGAAAAVDGSGRLWERMELLLPVVPRRADHPGRKRLDDRKVLSGTLATWLALTLGMLGAGGAQASTTAAGTGTEVGRRA
jgi:hypothetical protein